MTVANRRGWLGLVLLMTATFLVLGCGQAEHKGDGTQAKGDTAKKTEKDDEYEHDWWCGVHGIPEEICGLCTKEYRDKKKAEGDWCPLHKRLKSQCFKCDPTLYEKEFEPMYVAKYGKKPKRPPEKEFTK
jgi:hypothetical protein